MKTLIKNGLLIDPKNKVQSRLNILIEGGRIAMVSTNTPEADVVIDASNKIVCPGFIDIHMHEDPIDADGKIYADDGKSIFNCELRTGVTSVIGGQCGINVYDPLQYLEVVDRDGASVNVGMLAGHAYFRERYSQASKYDAVSDSELSEISLAIKKAVDGGCFGISYGIRYVPGIDARELYETAKHCQGTKKIIAAHVRDDAEKIFEATQEFIDVGTHFNLSTQVSHIGSMAGFGQMKDFLAMIDEYNMQGASISCDCYPYYAFSTNIGSTTYDDGWLERYNCGYDAVELCEGKYKGMRCTKEIFEEVRRDHPNCITVAFVMQEAEIDRAFSHPCVMLGSDGLMNKGQGHPRSGGSFSRFLSKFAMSGKISLYDAIAKMTKDPSEKLSLPHKGCLNVGADADIVIFNPQTICDKADFSDPTLVADGIDYVFVNGGIAVKNGKILNGNLGKALRI